MRVLRTSNFCGSSPQSNCTVQGHRLITSLQTDCPEKEQGKRSHFAKFYQIYRQKLIPFRKRISINFIFEKYNIPGTVEWFTICVYSMNLWPSLYRAGDYFSTYRWTDSPCRRIILVQVFILSVLAAGVKFRSARLLESSARYSSCAKYRPNVVLPGDFNFKIRHETVYILN